METEAVVGKHFLSYRVQYELTDNDRTRRKTFDSLLEANEWVKENKPYWWRIDQHIQIIVAVSPGTWFQATEDTSQPEPTEVDDGGLNDKQKEVLIAGYRGGEVVGGPSAAALRRRGLVNPGYHDRPRGLTKAGKVLAKALDTTSE